MDAGGLGGAATRNLANGSATNRAPRARVTGGVYLAYFLTAIVAQVLVGRKMVVAGDVVGLISYGFYAAVTVMFYLLFRPVSRVVSMVAAGFSLAGCLTGVMGVMHRAPAH